MAGLLEGRVAVITGAAGGIGRAAAAAFAAAGAQLVLADKSEDIPREYGEPFIADVSDAAKAAAVITDAVRLFGRVDVLFNIAGISGRSLGDGPVHECTEAAWDTVLRVNLKSVYLCCRAAIPEMMKTGGGAIVNLSSVLGAAGAAPHFETHAYAASKAAIIGLTRAMASSYAPYRIRVNCICPGLVETAMSARARAKPDLMDWVARRQSLTGGPVTPDDVAGAAVFLASDQAAAITGAVLPVDGGWLSQ
jgi:NAD(P)-dependent dehydrogenase (short-subunit alcohol dehydrogenase family)